MQVEAQIDQNTEISKEFSLWSSAGSSYSRGNMFVVPIEDPCCTSNRCIWKRQIPAFRKSSGSSLPTGIQIAYEATLADALNSLFGEGSAHESPGSEEASGDTDTSAGGSDASLSQTEIVSRAQEAFDNAQKAQKDGDWAKYGEYLKELEKYLKYVK